MPEGFEFVKYFFLFLGRNRKKYFDAHGVDIAESNVLMTELLKTFPAKTVEIEDEKAGPGISVRQHGYLAAYPTGRKTSPFMGKI